MKFPIKWILVFIVVFLIGLVSVLAVVNLRLIAKLNEFDIAPPQKTLAPKVSSQEASKSTPLVNMSTEEMNKFLPNSIADAVFLEGEDIQNPITKLMTLRKVYGLPGQYGSYIEIHVDRGCTYSTEEEATRERFEEIIAQTNCLESLSENTDGYFVKTYNNYPVVVYIHQGGRGMTAFFDYSWFRFSVICSNRYNSMYYIDAGIKSLLDNLNLTD